VAIIKASSSLRKTCRHFSRVGFMRTRSFAPCGAALRPSPALRGDTTIFSHGKSQCAGRHFSLGKERNPPALQLKLAARDRNRAAPKAMGGFGTARAVAGVLAASRSQQKATPDGGKSARPRAERSPRSPWSTVVI
jgi:hypothetical protein